MQQLHGKSMAQLDLGHKAKGQGHSLTGALAAWFSEIF